MVLPLRNASMSYQDIMSILYIVEILAKVAYRLGVHYVRIQCLDTDWLSESTIIFRLEIFLSAMAFTTPCVADMKDTAVV